MYCADTTQSQTQGSFHLYLSFEKQLQLTLCPNTQDKGSCSTNVYLSFMVQVKLMNLIKLNRNT